MQITLEASSKWPEDVEAIRQLKCAFYLKMSELLREQFYLKTHAFEDRLLVILVSKVRIFLFGRLISFFAGIFRFSHRSRISTRSGVIEIEERRPRSADFAK